VGDKRFEIGTSSFLKAWFSTIYIRLEKEDWGSVFPTIMREFYGGSLPYARAAQAAKELEIIKQQLAGFRPDEVVWTSRTEWHDLHGAIRSARK
jgi:hypothetical protein